MSANIEGTLGSGAHVPVREFYPGANSRMSAWFGDLMRVVLFTSNQWADTEKIDSVEEVTPEVVKAWFDAAGRAVVARNPEKATLLPPLFAESDVTPESVANDLKGYENPRGPEEQRLKAGNALLRMQWAWYVVAATKGNSSEQAEAGRTALNSLTTANTVLDTFANHRALSDAVSLKPQLDSNGKPLANGMYVMQVNDLRLFSKGTKDDQVPLQSSGILNAGAFNVPFETIGSTFVAMSQQTIANAIRDDSDSRRLNQRRPALVQGITRMLGYVANNTRVAQQDDFVYSKVAPQQSIEVPRDASLGTWLGNVATSLRAAEKAKAVEMTTTIAAAKRTDIILTKQASLLLKNLTARRAQTLIYNDDDPPRVFAANTTTVDPPPAEPPATPPAAPVPTPSGTPPAARTAPESPKATPARTEAARTTELQLVPSAAAQYLKPWHGALMTLGMHSAHSLYHRLSIGDIDFTRTAMRAGTVVATRSLSFNTLASNVMTSVGIFGPIASFYLKLALSDSIVAMLASPSSGIMQIGPFAAVVVRGLAMHGVSTVYTRYIAPLGQMGTYTALRITSARRNKDNAGEDVRFGVFLGPTGNAGLDERKAQGWLTKATIVNDGNMASTHSVALTQYAVEVAATLSIGELRGCSDPLEFGAGESALARNVSAAATIGLAAAVVGRDLYNQAKLPERGGFVKYFLSGSSSTTNQVATADINKVSLRRRLLNFVAPPLAAVGVTAGVVAYGVTRWQTVEENLLIEAADLGLQLYMDKDTFGKEALPVDRVRLSSLVVAARATSHRRSARFAPKRAAGSGSARFLPLKYADSVDPDSKVMVSRGSHRSVSAFTALFGVTSPERKATTRPPVPLAHATVRDGNTTPVVHVSDALRGAVVGGYDSLLARNAFGKLTRDTSEEHTPWGVESRTTYASQNVSRSTYAMDEERAMLVHGVASGVVTITQCEFAVLSDDLLRRYAKYKRADVNRLEDTSPLNVIMEWLRSAARDVLAPVYTALWTTSAQDSSASPMVVLPCMLAVRRRGVVDLGHRCVMYGASKAPPQLPTLIGAKDSSEDVAARNKAFLDAAHNGITDRTMSAHGLQRVQKLENSGNAASIVTRLSKLSELVADLVCVPMGMRATAKGKSNYDCPSFDDVIAAANYNDAVSKLRYLETVLINAALAALAIRRAFWLGEGATNPLWLREWLKASDSRRGNDDLRGVVQTSLEQGFAPAVYSRYNALLPASVTRASAYQGTTRTTFVGAPDP